MVLCKIPRLCILSQITGLMPSFSGFTKMQHRQKPWNVLFIFFRFTNYKLCVHVITIWILATNHNGYHNAPLNVLFFSHLNFSSFEQPSHSVLQISHRQTWGSSPGKGLLQNPITLSFQTISQPLRASAAAGGTNQSVVLWTERTNCIFFSFTRVSWTSRKGISLRVSFVLSCSNFSKHNCVTFATPPVSSTLLVSFIGLTFETLHCSMLSWDF